MKKRWFAVVVLGVALAAAMSAGEAQAGKKQFIKARINGKGFKAKGIKAAASTNGFGGFIFTGTKTTVSRRGGTQKTVTLGCSIPGLSPSSTFPVTATCGGGYADIKASLAGSTTHAWATDDMVTVIVTSFDGTRIVGTWSGQFEQAGETNPGDPPAPVENGKFSLDVLGG